MFEFQQNTLCVASSWLYETANLFSEGYYHKLVQRGKIKRITTGGNGRKALVAYESLPDRFKKIIREKGIDPYASVKNIVFGDYMEWDYDAEHYFRDYILDNGSHLPEEKQTEYTHQAVMFNTVKHIAVNGVIQKTLWG